MDDDGKLPSATRSLGVGVVSCVEGGGAFMKSPGVLTISPLLGMCIFEIPYCAL